jgi:PAS domain S-box-containing protein
MESLHKSEAVARPETVASHLRLVIDTIPCLIMSAKPNGSFDFVNRWWLELTGFKLEEVQGWGWRAALHPEDAGRVVKEWRAGLASGEPFETDARIRRVDGEYRWFLLRNVPLRDQEGRIVQWYGTGHDTDYLKRAKDRLRLAIDTTPALIHTGRPDGHLDYFNQRWLEYLGLPLEEICGWRWTHVIHPDDVEEMVKKWRSSLATGEVFEAEARVRRADGEYRWQFHRKVPLRDQSGKIVKWYGSSIDIEDRKRAEEALQLTSDDLQESKAKLEEAQRITHVGYWEWNLLTDRVNWSDETYRIYGLRPQECPMDLATVRGKIHPEDWESVSRALEEALSGGARYNAECRVFRPTGEVRIVHSQGDVKRDASGRPYQMFGTVQDITHRKRAQEALQQSEFYLAEGQRLAHVGSWALDSDGFDYWSPELFRMYGFDPASKAPGLQEYLNCIHSQDREFMASLITRILTEASSFDVTKRIVRPDGEVRYIRCVSAPIVNNQNPQKYIGSAIDVTEHELLTQELRRREAYLAEAQRLSQTGSFGWRPDCGEIVWSDETYRIFEYDHAVKPTIDLLVQRVHPEDRPDFLKVIESASAGATKFEHTYRWLLPDGSVKHVHALAHALQDASGNREFVGAATDITEQTRARDDLEKAFEEIEKLKDQLYKENLALKEEIDQTSMFEEIIGSSAALRRVLVHVAKVAPTDSTVLITGETGTGKELVARAVHKRSHRAAHAFVSVNCAAIPQSLIASELFGYEKGAFTGASQRRLGRFELADGGTLFLDEVGELPSETQIALLRVLQERAFERVGGNQPISVDVRVLAATNRDLKAAVDAGTFRRDLFYRLSVFPIHMPPLRERVDDIPLLVEYLTERYANKIGRKIRNIKKKTLELFQDYDWPGNIRELQNVVERAVILCDGDILEVDETWLQRESPRQSVTHKGLARLDLNQEKELIEAALAECHGRVSGPDGAAAKVGIPRSTFESRIRSLQIDKHRFRSS